MSEDQTPVVPAPAQYSYDEPLPTLEAEVEAVALANGRREIALARMVVELRAQIEKSRSSIVELVAQLSHARSREEPPTFLARAAKLRTDIERHLILVGHGDEVGDHLPVTRDLLARICEVLKAREAFVS